MVVVRLEEALLEYEEDEEIQAEIFEVEVDEFDEVEGPKMERLLSSWAQCEFDSWQKALDSVERERIERVATMVFPALRSHESIKRPDAKALSGIDKVMLSEIREDLKNKVGVSKDEAFVLKLLLGDPTCERCGKCCQIVPCLYCYHKYGNVDRCPELKQNEDVWVCNAFETSKGTDMEDVLRGVLCIGCGCCCPEGSPRKRQTEMAKD